MCERLIHFYDYMPVFEPLQVGNKIRVTSSLTTKMIKSVKILLGNHKTIRPTHPQIPSTHENISYTAFRQKRLAKFKDKFVIFLRYHGMVVQWGYSYGV